MDNLIVETVQPKYESKQSQWEGVQMLGSQNGYQRFVIRFQGDLLSQYVICESFTSNIIYRVPGQQTEKLDSY